MAPRKKLVIPKKTRLLQILEDRNIPQSELVSLIEQKYNRKVSNDRISRMCTGKLFNVTSITLVLIAGALDVPVDQIVERERLLLSEY